MASLLALVRRPTLLLKEHPNPTAPPGEEGGVPLSIYENAMELTREQNMPKCSAQAPALSLGARVWVPWFGIHPPGGALLQRRWCYVPWPPPTDHDAPPPVRLVTVQPRVCEALPGSAPKLW